MMASIASIDGGLARPSTGGNFAHGQLGVALIVQQLRGGADDRLLGLLASGTAGLAPYFARALWRMTFHLVQ
jgi:hypothetical protein